MVTVHDICREAAYQPSPDEACGSTLTPVAPQPPIRVREAIDFLHLHAKLQPTRPAMREAEMAYEKELATEKAHLPIP